MEIIWDSLPGTSLGGTAYADTASKSVISMVPLKNPKRGFLYVRCDLGGGLVWPADIGIILGGKWAWWPADIGIILESMKIDEKPMKIDENR